MSRDSLINAQREPINSKKNPKIQGNTGILAIVSKNSIEGVGKYANIKYFV